ncbi:MAG: NYN domain-containing protein [Acidobacteria bacterium]|nr:MAG: NYN domain-containing protein [Acidobacteriota bacterium]REK11250.1 MAG: NYN domain-containing protein [Acidobacteriota bacterium]
MSTTNSEPDQQAAILLDLENLVIAFEKQGRGRKKKDPEIAPLIEFMENTFGPVSVRRAYANWAREGLEDLQRELLDLGVEMVHVPKRTRRSKKNGADILLTADAVECLLLRPFIEVFAVVSGDSDIGPLVNKLKSHGKTVVVIGPDRRSTARHVIELADRFKFYDDIVATTKPSPASTSAAPKRRSKSPQRQVIDLLRAAEAPIESALLKRKLMQTPSGKGFSEKEHGFKSWTAFLESIDGVDVLRRSDLGVEVRWRKRA